MTQRIQDAIADAMVRLRSSDIAGATSAIRNALTGRRPPASFAPSAPANLLRNKAGRRLGDVLSSLKSRQVGVSSSPLRPIRTPTDNDPRFTSHSLSTATGTLSYKLFVPLDRDRDLALILMLHGCTQDPDDFACGTRMNRLADEFGLVVAYPHQPRSANANGCWNWFDRRHQSPGAGEPAKLAALAKTLSGEFGIAPERVFAAGLSAGAAMADVLAEIYPEVFSKVGLHSGLPYGAAHDVMSAFAAMKGDGAVRRSGGAGRGASRKIIIHGTADQTVHASNGDRIFEEMRARHPDSTLIVSDVKSSGKSATRQALIGTSGEVWAEYLPIEGAGHAWSGGDRSGSFTDPDGPDASREMVRFFLRP
jgi:poly(hydroxyalkanoate) depolymerase family esterase